MINSDERDYTEEAYNRAEMEREGREELIAEGHCSITLDKNCKSRDCELHYMDAPLKLRPEDRKDIPSVTQWACLCCLLVMANGECCEKHPANPVDEFIAKAMGWDDPRPQDARIDVEHDKEPLSEIPEGAHTTLGMFFENHDDTCTRKIRPESVTGDYECDCETIPFSHKRCDGCGSGLAGERHAFVVWTPAAHGKCPKCESECYWHKRTESGVDWFECGNRVCKTAYTQQELAR